VSPRSPAAPSRLWCSPLSPTVSKTPRVTGGLSEVVRILRVADLAAFGANCALAEERNVVGVSFSLFETGRLGAAIQGLAYAIAVTSATLRDP
jgi:hypothetical protein